jgi:hypothetical protein
MSLQEILVSALHFWQHRFHGAFCTGVQPNCV